MERQLERTLALSGLFQAAAQAHEVATSYGSEPTDLTASVHAIFALSPDNVGEIYPWPSRLRTGFTLIETAFKRPQAYPRALPADYVNRSIRYALMLINLEKLLLKNPELTTRLRDRIEQSSRQLSFVESPTDPQILHQLAQTYVDTIGQLKYRIHVVGNAAILKKDENTDKVRTLLLAGIRAAMLWRQLGGKRWQLLFNRKQILQNVQTLKQST